MEVCVAMLMQGVGWDVGVLPLQLRAGSGCEGLVSHAEMGTLEWGNTGLMWQGKVTPALPAFSWSGGYGCVSAESPGLASP